MRQQRLYGFSGPIVFYAAVNAAPEVVTAALRGGAQDVLYPVAETATTACKSISHALVRDWRGEESLPDSRKQWITDRFLEAQALARVGSWEVDVKTWTVEWSPEFRRITGISLHDAPLEVEGYAGRTHPDDRARVVGELLGLFKNGEPFDSEHRLIHPDGTEVFVHAIGRCLRDAGGNIARAYGTTQDVTARKRLELELAHLSMRDDLTHLHNRRGFMKAAAALLETARHDGYPTALLFGDINGLKQINDRLGHDVGDEAICAMADILTRTLSRSDIIARLGGDEFVALVTRPSLADIDAIPCAIGAGIRRHNASAVSYRLSASVGITLYDSSRPSTVDDLLNAADARMYEAKRYRRVHGSDSTLPSAAEPS